jgi:hypothetical protein
MISMLYFFGWSGAGGEVGVRELGWDMEVGGDGNWERCLVREGSKK